MAEISFCQSMPKLRVLLLGAVMGLGQAPFGLWPIFMLGLFAFIRILHRSDNWRDAAQCAGFAGFGYFLVVLHWLVFPFVVEPSAISLLAPFALVAMAGILALFWAAFLAVARAMGGGLWLVIGLSLAEFTRSVAFTGFPWGLLSYTFENIGLAQSFAVFGPYGMVVVVVFLAGLPAILQRGQLWGLGVSLGLFIGMWGAGVMRPPQGPADMHAKTIRLVQPNAPQAQKWDPRFSPFFFNVLIKETSAAARVDAVIWPESALPNLLNYADDMLDQMSGAAPQLPILFGVLRRAEDGAAYNSAALLKNQEIQAIYDKAHLVPFGEYLPLKALLGPLGFGALADQFGGFDKGARGQALIEIMPNINARVLICYEAIFPQYANNLPRPDVLVHLTNDGWFGPLAGPKQHLAQARLRAIEQGIPLARVANTGITAMIDPFGRITGQLEMGARGHLDARLPKPIAPTIYALAGDWIFAVMLMVLSIFAFAWRGIYPNQANGRLNTH